MAAVKIGFVGAGKMAQALAKGFLTAGLTKGSDIIASSPPQDEHLLKVFKELGTQTTVDNALVAQKSQVTILAVKPQIIPAVLNDIRSSVTTENLIISIAPGISVKTIEDGLAAGSRVVRVMPNTPAQVQCGASVFACGRAVTQDDALTVRDLMLSVGTCDQVPEQLMDAVTALSSCGPAYVYLVIEALADGGVKMGLPRDLSYKLAAQTIMGAGKMVADTGRHPGQLKDDVTSPGGCTAAGIHYLENFRFRAALIGAVEQATLHSKGVK